MVSLDAEFPGGGAGPNSLDEFAFELPETLIAQHPAPVREASRLLVLDRRRGTLDHRQFVDIVDYFKAGDLLVLNDTRVIPARLAGIKDSGGRIEVFLVRRLAGSAEVWSCLTRSSKPPRLGSRIRFADGGTATVLAGGQAPLHHLEFAVGDDFSAWLEMVGTVPLPPYIRRTATAADRHRYQTVFARSDGALAAPTAGLHFTDRILTLLRERGVEIRPLTLHVGLGTFLPVRVENLRDHRMHSESYAVPEETAVAVNRARSEGRRVVALGTTTTRALEAAAGPSGDLRAGTGETDLFIRPGFPFRIIDGLVTNFHLPRSTLLVLVAAFAGREFVLQAYEEAVRERFRFFSYGDCMLIL
jgi:S-adenosylmethionine:tRNA ribosyltransferase-isomerase